MQMADEDRDKKTTDVRVTERELPKLLAAPAQEGEPRHERLTVEELQGRSNLLRDEHYEQVGQFIAESAMIMIAVTKANEAADTTKATGGTNRIVAYRRAGYDAIGAEVGRKSLILRRTIREPAAPPVRFVWLIDPSNTSAQFDPDDYPVTSLRPFFTHTTDENYAQATFAGAHAGLVRDLATSLLLVGRIDRFNARVATGGDLVADIRPIEPGMLIGEIERVTEMISERQVRTNRTSRWCFRLIAGFFIIAIFTFETFVKFFEHNPFVLLGYLGILTLIGAVVWVAQANAWQPDAEDYRAVAEMLRVQSAWWSAGIDERVDREHLQGASPDLIPIRYAGTAIIAWLLLRCGWTIPQADWSKVRGTGRSGTEDSAHSSALDRQKY